MIMQKIASAVFVLLCAVLAFFVLALLVAILVIFAQSCSNKGKHHLKIRAKALTSPKN